MKVIILAGGLGSRMGALCSNTPKPLLTIKNKPILLYQIEAFKREGLTDITIVTGYLSKSIYEYFGNGEKFGVNISYYKENEPLGTAGALFNMNLSDDFILCNGDLIFDIDFHSMLSFHKANDALATLFSHPNSHPKDSLTLVTNDSHCIISLYDKNSKPDFYPNLCNAGIQIVSPKLLSNYKYSGKVDFDKDILQSAIKSGKIFAYKSAEYVYDIGTPSRLKKAEEDLSRGIVSRMNRRHPKKAIFLDRDGTINIHKNYITDPNNIELLPGVTTAINNFHKLGFLVIVITNQPIIARGDCSLEDLKNIHNKLEMLLSEDNAYLDGIYFCPHHPDKGFPGEVKELKINCLCRKPEPGMIFQAKKDFNIDLTQSYMVGDSISDIEAGKKAGCKTIMIEQNKNDASSFDSLLNFSKHLFPMNQYNRKL